MTLWQPDLYADPEPHWHPATAPEVLAIVTLLDQHYSVKGITGVEVAGDQHRNSRNWRVTPVGVVVKRLTQPERYAEGLMVAQAVAAKHLPMLTHLPNHAGALVFPHDGAWWTVTEYMAGQFFRGTRIESSRVVEMIDSLDRVLTSLSCSLTERPLITEEELEWCTLLPIPSCHPHIEEVRTTLPALRALGKGVAHVDLHPHNLLCDPTGSVVAILDVESFRQASRITSLAFAGFKLGRHVAQRYGEPTLARKFFQALSLYTGLPSALSWIAAKAELLKRLALIAHVMRDHDFQWTSNLAMHVSGLEEIEAIRQR